MKTASPLTDFAAQATLSREAFFRDLEHLPDELHKVVVSNYNERVARCNGKPMLGEYIPWLLADMIPLKDRDILQTIAPAWLGLYTYTIFVDDLLDISGKPDAGPLLLASGLLLQRGLSNLYQALPPGVANRAQISSFWLAAAGAVLRELQNHKGKLQAFNEEDINRLGEKVSLLSLCASCILVADGYEDVSDGVLKPVEAFATGMQLLDDMTDWEEDWRSGNFTHILTRTFSFLRYEGEAIDPKSADLTSSEVLTAIVLTGSLEDCLSRGIGFVQSVLAAPGFQSSSSAYRLLRAIKEESIEFLDEVRLARDIVQKNRTTQKPYTALSQLSRDPLVRRNITTIERKLKILAQHT